jgi:hypothetical protein
MPRTRKPETNTEFVTRVIDFSRNGALMNAFVIEGLRLYAEQCVKRGAAHFDSGLINGAAWVACAEEYIRELEALRRDDFIPQEI